MGKKLTLKQNDILRFIQLASDYSRQHDIVVPRSEKVIDLGEYIKSGEYERQHDLGLKLPERRLFISALESLSLKQMRELQGIMYLGRGDFDASCFWEGTNALPMGNDITVEADTLEEKLGSLCQYLKDGLDKAQQGNLFVQ